MNDRPWKKILRVDLVGAKYHNWRTRKKAAFVRALQSARKRLFSAEINAETGETVEDESKKLTSKGLRALEAQLDKQPFENELIRTQIEQSYEEKERIRAEVSNLNADTRKKSAEARALELANIETALILLKEVEEKTGKKLDFTIGGKMGNELILFPAETEEYLAERLLSDTAESAPPP